MPNILQSQNFNPASLQADDLYIVISPPPAYITGVPSSVVGMVGTASWGPLNVPILLNTTTDMVNFFGGVTAAAITDQHDLCTDVMLAFAQASAGRGSLQIWGVRVSDGTDVKATGALNDTNSQLGATFQAIYSGVSGNGIQVITSAGGVANTTNVSIVAFNGALSEIFVNIPNTGFWVALQAALLNGQSGIRGPSQLGRISVVGSSVLSPAIGSITLTGGTDGRSVNTAQLLGSDTTSPRTGMYSLRHQNPPVAVVDVVGLTDNTAYAAQDAFASSEGLLAGLTWATGETSAAAIASKQSAGISDYSSFFIKDWLYFYDTINGIVRLVPPLGVACGLIATLNPSLSPSNKQVYGVLGTERINTTTGVIQPYSLGEIGQLEAAGINVITNPVPGGQYYGMRMGVNASVNPVQSPIEYTLMTNWIASSLASFMGSFVGQLQSTSPNDPVRAGVVANLTGFFQILEDSNMIDSYQVICTLSTTGSAGNGYNTPASIAQHYLYALALVRYLSSIKFFVISLIGGTTVVTTQNALNTQVASSS